MDPITAIGAGALSLEGNLLAGWMNNSAAASRQQNAQNFGAEQFATRYRTTMKDMQAAGLNPMLAYMQGASGQPSGSATSSAGYSPLGSETVSAVNDSRIASATEAKIEADTEKSKAETANINTDTLGKANVPARIAAETALALQSAETAKAQMNKYIAELPQINEQIKTLKTQQEKNKSDVNLNSSLQTLNLYKQALEMSITQLNQQALSIGTPKEKASRMSSAVRAEEAEQQTKINRSYEDSDLNIMNVITKPWR